MRLSHMTQRRCSQLYTRQNTNPTIDAVQETLSKAEQDASPGQSFERGQHSTRRFPVVAAETHPTDGCRGGCAFCRAARNPSFPAHENSATRSERKKRRDSRFFGP
jgi:hypothetical protein